MSALFVPKTGMVHARHFAWAADSPRRKAPCATVQATAAIKAAMETLRPNPTSGMLLLIVTVKSEDKHGSDNEKDREDKDGGAGAGQSAADFKRRTRVKNGVLGRRKCCRGRCSHIVGVLDG